MPGSPAQRTHSVPLDPLYTDLGNGEELMRESDSERSTSTQSPSLQPSKRSLRHSFTECAPTTSAVPGIASSVCPSLVKFECRMPCAVKLPLTDQKMRSQIQRSMLLKNAIDLKQIRDMTLEPPVANDSAQAW